MKKTKIRSMEGVEYTLSTITAGTARLEFNDTEGNALPNRLWNIALIGNALIAGGHVDGEAIARSIPIFMGGLFGEFLSDAMIVNGLKTEKAAGEVEAGAGPALVEESTGNSSTEDWPAVSDGDSAT